MTMGDTELPAELYKYLSFRNTRNLQSVFVDSDLYFSRPDSFNDPFEFTPRHYKPKKFRRLNASKARITDDGMKRVLDSQWVEYYEEINKRGVYCLSAQYDDIVMWSHYADGHHGLCVVFRTNNTFFNRARKADYDPARANLNPFDIAGKQRLNDVMLRKLNMWKYEDEWRLIDDGGDKLYPYPSDALAGVIFGCKSHKKDRELVYKLTVGRDLSFWLASLSKYEYKLEFQSIERGV